MKQLLVASAVTVVLAGCALPAADRAVRAYDACIARHPQETMVCEGPRQAYEADAPTLQARVPDMRPVGP